ncbi:MAG TPA: hypothetical protein VFU97_24335 [Xanthobacteraceae bacterium]|nr:hypothetical protein [Xanthobacteraceae bacterium]
MPDHPTPEQRADLIARLCDMRAADARAEHVGLAIDEIRRLQSELSAEREDHNAAKTNWERAAGELRDALERAEKAEQLARAYAQTLEERTRERDAARSATADESRRAYNETVRAEQLTADLAQMTGVMRHVRDGRDKALAELDALRAQLEALRPGEGEALVRMMQIRFRTETWVRFRAGDSWLLAPESAIVQFPPSAPGDGERDQELRKLGQAAVDLSEGGGDCPFCTLRDDGSHDDRPGLECPAGVFLRRFPPSAQDEPREGGGETR